MSDKKRYSCFELLEIKKENMSSHEKRIVNKFFHRFDEDLVQLLKIHDEKVIGRLRNLVYMNTVHNNHLKDRNFTLDTLNTINGVIKANYRKWLKKNFKRQKNNKYTNERI